MMNEEINEEINVVAAIGSGDAEGSAIRTALGRAGIPVHQAMCGGQPVHPGNAYRADATDPPLPDGDVVIWRVECDGPIFAGRKVVVIDHHRPGDPGYGRPPAEFWEASSLGQIVGLIDEMSLDRDPSNNEEHLMIAAADHCLAAAYRGLCPGVTPDALMQWRAKSRAEFQKRPVEAVLADIEAARKSLYHALESGRFVRVGCWKIVDFRDVPPIPELPEASARDGIPFLATVTERDGRKKVVLQGSSASPIIDEFLAGRIVPGLVDLYGDPARGLAGGYLP